MIERNDIMDQAVNGCFGALIAAMQTCADDWRMQAAEAYFERDDTRAQECGRAIDRIKEAAREVETVYHAWKRKWPPPTSYVTSPGVAVHHKGSGSKLRVDLNGKVIECPEAAETFARTIEGLGIERVLRLGKVLSGISLVSTSRTTGYQQQCRIGEFYICTHSNTLTKKRILDEIAVELGVPVGVEIASPDENMRG